MNTRNCQNSFFIFATLFFLFILKFDLYAVDMTVIYPQFQSANDTRFLDLVELLHGSLENTIKTDGPFTYRPAEFAMNEKRYVIEAQKGTRINLIWCSTNEDIEKKLIPIRIPLRKGLLGYRIFLIRKEDQQRFAKIKTLDALKKLRVGQGFDWGDVNVFIHNGFNLVTGSTYERLFSMLTNRRFDYFSRGVNEAYPEWETRRDQYSQMMVEEKLLLFYPWPYYFFVSKKSPEIAARVEKGLNIMIKNGSFDEIFLKYHQKTIDRAKMKDRILFKIDNTILTPKTPLNRSELWYDPFK